MEEIKIKKTEVSVELFRELKNVEEKCGQVFDNLENVKNQIEILKEEIKMLDYLLLNLFEEGEKKDA